MEVSDGHFVAADDAKTDFSELLERVAAGERITITRQGAPVARLVPFRPGSSEEQRQAAIVAMRQLASRNRLRGLNVKTLIDEGRK